MENVFSVQSDRFIILWKVPNSVTFQACCFYSTERTQFDFLVHTENHSVREYAVHLRTPTAKCVYGSQLQELLWDRLFTGITQSVIQADQN